jgi:hypothetical protein
MEIERPNDVKAWPGLRAIALNGYHVVAKGVDCVPEPAPAQLTNSPHDNQSILPPTQLHPET